MNLTGWKALASARGLEMEEAELDRVLDALQALERRFRPLALGIAPTLHPATIFRADQEPRE